EATIASSYYDVTACPTDPKSQIPIGKPCDGEDLLVLNDRLEPVPVREIGDLFITGVGLSPGYWRDPAKTAAAFIQDPHSPARRLYRTGDLAYRDEQGLVWFVGRADTQIKVRGYRIELGEIETALNSMGKLQECAVVAIPTDNFGGYMICAAYVVRAGEQAALGDLRDHLKKLVPNYMMPARWTAYQALPKNANGKIDRPRLKDAFARNENGDKPEESREAAKKSSSTTTPSTGASFVRDDRS
ncbi:MAG: AMP-binding protein, partial [Acidobacteria bacterium]|nr:AMP-binding protein [Acidobacteriota bacterium]